MSGSSEPWYPSSDAVEACQARGMFKFVVSDYSRVDNDMEQSSYIRSPVFKIGGYDWSILFFPGGHETNNFASVTLKLLTKGYWVAVSYDMGLIDQNTGSRHYVAECEVVEFDARPGSILLHWHLSSFMDRSELEETSRFIRHDDSLVIICTLVVLKSTPSLPQSNLTEHLGRLLEDGDGTDVTFEVEGEKFPAHRILVAARSPVFKVELLGPMKEGSVDLIPIKDMKPDVFKALLHFIYTDSLPSMDDLIKGDNVELARDILIAADRYAMDNLKLLCEHILSANLGLETVTALLAVADKYNCRSLKDACSEFMIDYKMEDVMQTEGYRSLKEENPSLLVEVLEMAARQCRV